MEKNKLLLVALLMVGFCCSPENSAAGPADYPWTSYFGSHENAAPWGQSIRGVGRLKTGLALIQSGRLVNMDAGSEFSKLEQEVGRLVQKHDLIIPVGGLLAAQNQQEVSRFFDMVRSDGGKLWKETVYKQAVRFARLPQGGERIYWQVGNEINSPKHCSAISAWAGRPTSCKPNDPSILPYYVEYFLAPTVEALRSASQDVFGSKDKIKVLLGTIAVASRPKSREWLDSLLRMRVRGDFAKSLAGAAVADLVDVVGIHYVVTPSMSEWGQMARTSWQDSLQSLYRELMGRGRIRAVWSTEELGGKRAEADMGASTSISVAARYLYWWHRHSLTPAQVRCFLWGANLGKPGTTGDSGMKILYDFLGDTRLRLVEGGISGNPGTRAEIYLFESVDDPSKRIVFLLPEGTADRIAVQGLRMPAGGWSSGAKATIHVFSARGHASLPAELRRSSDGYELPIPREAIVDDKPAVVVFIRAEK